MIKGDSKVSRGPVINKTTQDVSFIIEPVFQHSERFFFSPKYPDKL
jgi:hypothetical protein